MVLSRRDTPAVSTDDLLKKAKDEAAVPRALAATGRSRRRARPSPCTRKPRPP